MIHSAMPNPAELFETVHIETTGHRVRRSVNPATELVVSEEWTWRDKLDRPDGPAYLMRDRFTGLIVMEEWAKAGLWHRTDGPAVLERDRNTGIVTLEDWFLNGNRWCRTDGACLVQRHHYTGAVIFELWGEKDRLSRADGPAMIWRDAAGKEVREEWWTNGRRIAERHYAPLEHYHGSNLKINRYRLDRLCC